MKMARIAIQNGIEVGPFFWKNSSTGMAYAEVKKDGKTGVIDNQGTRIVPIEFDVVAASIYGNGETVGFVCSNRWTGFKYYDMYGIEHDCATWLYHNGIVKLRPQERLHIELVGIMERFSALDFRGKCVLVRGSDDKWSIYEAGREWVQVAHDVDPDNTSFEKTTHVEVLEYYSNVSCRYGARVTAKGKSFDIAPEFSGVSVFGDYLVKAKNNETRVALIRPDGETVLEMFPVGNLFEADITVIRDENWTDTGYFIFETPPEAVGVDIQTSRGWVTERSVGKSFCLLSRTGQIVSWAREPIRYCGKAGSDLSFLVQCGDTYIITVPDLSLTYR